MRKPDFIISEKLFSENANELILDKDGIPVYSFERLPGERVALYSCSLEGEKKNNREFTIHNITKYIASACIMQLLILIIIDCLLRCYCLFNGYDIIVIDKSLSIILCVFGGFLFAGWIMIDIDEREREFKK